MSEVNKELSRQNIWLGTLELGLFMGEGIKRFPSSVKLAQYSFLVPFLLMFLWLCPLYIVPTERLGERNYGELFHLYSTITVLYLGFYYAAIWAVMRQLKKLDKFCAFVTMQNFVSIPALIFNLPLLLMVVAGRHSWDDVYPMMVVLIFYEIALSAFILTRHLNIPWQLGAALGIVSLFVHETVSSFVLSMFGIG